MGSGGWGWIVPDGLWDVVAPLLPAARMRPQGGGTANLDDEAVFAAIVAARQKRGPPTRPARASTLRTAAWSAEQPNRSTPPSPGPGSTP